MQRPKMIVSMVQECMTRRLARLIVGSDTIKARRGGRGQVARLILRIKRVFQEFR
jgi:hypothetical protein